MCRSEPPAKQPGARLHAGVERPASAELSARRSPGSLVDVVEHVLHAVDSFLGLVLRVLDRLLDLAAGLVRLARAPPLVVVGEISGDLFRTTFELVIAA